MKKLVCSIVVVLVFAGASFGAKADIDLTKFSSVMVYSGLLNAKACRAFNTFITRLL